MPPAELLGTEGEDEQRGKSSESGTGSGARESMTLAMAAALGFPSGPGGTPRRGGQRGTIGEQLEVGGGGAGEHDTGDGGSGEKEFGSLLGSKRTNQRT